MSARDLWDQLIAGGWQELSRWRVEAVPESLHLDPGDRNEGRATFVYEFKPAPAATPTT